jgi:exopolyphosphatase/guanosine-5'-triphosphate,3'-diphosphate pyrophosphatase
MTVDEITGIDAVGNNRAETITAGSCIIKILMQKLGFNGVVVSAQGLREGILLSFLESPQQYDKESITQNKIQNHIRVNCELAITSKHSGDLISPLISNRMLKEKEYLILNLAIKQMSKIPATTSLYNLFYTLIDEDLAYLTHSEQLILALSIIHTKKPKIANWLFKRYDSILRSQNKRSIEKISACIVILAILERTKCHVNLTFYNEKKIVVAVVLDDNIKFPEMLFRNALKKFETTFNVVVDFSISIKSNRGTTTTSTTAMRKEILLR